MNPKELSKERARTSTGSEAALASARTPPWPGARLPCSVLLGTALLVTACDMSPDAPSAGTSEARQSLLEDGFKNILGPMGRCLSLSTGVSNGAVVDLANCVGRGRKDQLWKQDGSRLRSAVNQSFCITAEGSGLLLRSCSTNRSDQVFSIDGYMRLPASNRCVQGWNTPIAPWTLTCPAQATPAFTWRWFVATGGNYKIPIDVVKLVEDDGRDPVTNPLTASTMQAAIARISALYARVGVEFSFTPADNWHVTPNSALNNHDRWHDSNADFESFESKTRPLINRFPRSVVVFLAKAVTGPAFSTGPSTVPPTDLIGYWPTAQTELHVFGNLAHEIGHFLGLTHTFWDGDQATYEALIKGKTAAEAENTLNADLGYVDDTPADISWGGSGPLCTSNIVLSLGNGNSVTLNPDRFNMMGYWGCSSTHRSITPGEALVIRENTKWRRMMPIGARDIAGTQFSDNRTIVLGSDPDLQVVSRQKASSDASSGWTTWDFHQIPGASPTSLAAAQLSNGNPEVFAVANGNILTWWWNGTAWSGPVGFNVPDTIPARVAAATTGGIYHVFATDIFGGLYERRKLNSNPDAGWTSWTRISLSHAVNALTVGRLPDGRLQMFYSDATGGLFSIWQGGAGGWSDPVGMGLDGVMDVDVGTLSDGRLQLFAVVAPGNIRTRFKLSPDSNAGWTAWTTFRGSEQTRFTNLATVPLSNGATQLIGVRERRVMTSYLSNPNDPNTYSEWNGF